MHEEGVRVGLCHELSIDLIATELIMATLTGRLWIMHTDPCISDDQIRTLYRDMGIAFDYHIRPFCARLFQKSIFWIKGLWPCKCKIKAELTRSMSKTGKNIVTIS